MGRVTHSKATRSVPKQKDLNIKTIVNSFKDIKANIEPSRTIEHINTTVEIDSIPEIYKTLSDFSTLSLKVVKWYDDNELIIKNSDMLTCDMLHEFELGAPKDLGRAYKCYKKLRESRQLRRRAKVENKMLTPLYEYIKTNPTLPKELMNLNSKCAGIQYDINHSAYYFKTDYKEEF